MITHTNIPCQPMWGFLQMVPNTNSMQKTKANGGIIENVKS